MYDMIILWYLFFLSYESMLIVSYCTKGENKLSIYKCGGYGLNENAQWDVSDECDRWHNLID